MPERSRSRLKPLLYDLTLAVVGLTLLFAALSAYSYAVTAMLGPLEGVQLDAKGDLPPLAPLKVRLIHAPLSVAQPLNPPMDPAQERLIWHRILQRLPVTVTETGLEWLPSDKSEADVVILPWGSLAQPFDDKTLQSYLASGGGVLAAGPATENARELARLATFFNVTPENMPSNQKVSEPLSTLAGPAPQTWQLQPGAHPWGYRLLPTGEPLYVNHQALRLPCRVPDAQQALRLTAPWTAETSGQTGPGAGSPQQPPPGLPFLALQQKQRARTAWLASPLTQVYGLPTDTTPLAPLLPPLLQWLASRPLLLPTGLPPEPAVQVALAAEAPQLRGVARLHTLTEKLELPVTWFASPTLAHESAVMAGLRDRDTLSLLGQAGLLVFSRTDRAGSLRHQLQRLMDPGDTGPARMPAPNTGYLPPIHENNAQVRTAVQEAGFLFMLQPTVGPASPLPYRPATNADGPWQVTRSPLVTAEQLETLLKPGGTPRLTRFQAVVLRPELLEDPKGQPTPELAGLEKVLLRLRASPEIRLESLSQAMMRRNTLEDLDIRVEALRLNRLHLRLSSGPTVLDRADLQLLLPPGVRVTEVINHDLRTPSIAWTEAEGLLKLTITPLDSHRVLDYFVGLAPLAPPQP